MTKTTEINTDGWKVTARAKLRFLRHGHSCCMVGDKFIIATGSRKEIEAAHMKVEQYNVNLDIWFDAPDLNEGRHYHSSCGFKDHIVYVFAGIANSTKKYINSIERYDMNNRTPWERISPPEGSFKPR